MRKSGFVAWDDYRWSACWIKDAGFDVRDFDAEDVERDAVRKRVLRKGRREVWEKLRVG